LGVRAVSDQLRPDQPRGAELCADRPGAGKLRVDKWLWHARFFKSRTIASALCASGRLRVNGQVVSKAHQTVGPGDVLTFPQGALIRVVRIKALSGRRGPPGEARGLYEDLSPPQGRESRMSDAHRPRGSGRPTKADRRAIARLKGLGD
jgi:ribosome-associated heat shock protein Hsp15